MTDIKDLKKLKGCLLKCEQPNERLYNFDGSIEIDKKVYALEAKQVLLRVFIWKSGKTHQLIGCYAQEH